MKMRDSSSNMQQAWFVRGYKNGDEDGILQLIQLAFKWGDKKYWNWRYRDNPAGIGRIWLADDFGKIVGHYAMIPVKMKIGDETVTSSLSADIVTHPDYRRQGIFETLARKAYAEAGKEGEHILCAFPNEFSYPGFIKKIGWFEVCRLNTFVKPLNLENALKRYLNNRLLRKFCASIGNSIINSFYRTKKSPEVDGLTITRVSSFDDRIDDFWNRVSNDYDIIVERKKEYLNWKYVEVPLFTDFSNTNFVIYVAEKEGQICGYVILKCKKQRDLLSGCIYDLIAPLDQEEVISCLISKAIEYFKGEKVDLILCGMIADKTYYTIFKKNGFIPSRIIIKKHFCVYSSHPEISRVHLKNPKHYFIQIGDSEGG